MTVTIEYERIVRAHGPSLARLAWGYVRTAQDHEDLMQDIFLAIWRALPRFRHGASERTYVYRIAHNQGYTFRARHGASRDVALDMPIEDPRPRADDALDELGKRERLLNVVRTLPEGQRQAVLLRLEGFSIAEIATLQNTTENNVSVRLTRATERLREQLAERP